MRFPSLDDILRESRRTIVRFPLSITAAIVGSLAAATVVDREIGVNDPWWVLNSVFVACSIGISLGAVIVFVGERQRLGGRALLLAQAIGALLVVAYGYSLPHDVYSPPYMFGIRHWLLLCCLHLLVASGPYLGRGETAGFWQFNKSLFLRFLVSALYTAVLYAGLSIALLAVDQLFALDIRPQRYLELWIILAGVFNTWFFFSGVPGNLDELEHDQSYPRGLKLFTQYVLLPLVVVYFLILYAYVVKIVVLWDWPKGWVANLVLGFSIAGMFSLLLVHPIRQASDSRWISRFARWYYMAEIPLVVVLLLSVARRVQEYGITENRYFVLVLGLWLAAMVLIFLLRRDAPIKVIPISLCLLSFAVSFGPWGAFAVSEGSQKARLERILSANGMLENGRAKKAASTVPVEDVREISSIVTYLHDVHGLSCLQPWFAISLDTLGDGASRGSQRESRKPELVVAALGVSYVPEWQMRETAYRTFTSVRPGVCDVAGYGLVVRGVAATAESGSGWVTHDSGSTGIAVRGSLLIVRSLAPDSLADSIGVDLAPLVRRLMQEIPQDAFHKVPPAKMVVDATGRTTSVRILPSQLSVRMVRDSVEVRRIEADILLR